MHGAFSADIPLDTLEVQVGKWTDPDCCSPPGTDKDVVRSVKIGPTQVCCKLRAGLSPEGSLTLIIREKGCC
jgi:hypothetical protein